MPSAQAGKTSNGLPVKYALNIPPNMNKSECVPSLKRLQPYLGKYGYPLWYLQYMCQKRGCTFVKKKAGISTFKWSRNSLAQHIFP